MTDTFDKGGELYPTMSLRFVSRPDGRVLQQWHTIVKGDEDAEGIWVDVELEDETEE